MEISLLGLALIAAGWIIQLSHAWRGIKEIQLSFIALYAVGVFILVVDGYTAGSKETALLNLACLITAVLVLIRVSRIK